MPFKAGAIIGEAILETGRWDKGIKHIGKSSLKVAGLITGAFVGAMTISIAKANTFQKSMSNVATVIDTSAISTQEMTFELLKMDPALGKTTALTDGLYQAFSAGAEDMEAAMTTTVDAAKFAGAAITSNATAVDVLTTASNAYGSEIVSTTKASDIFFTTIKKGKITGEQLASTIGQSIPLFASTGIEIEQLSSGMAAMTKQGISAAESTTQLNAIVNSVLKPTDALAEAISSVGFESSAAFLESEGLTGVLSLMEDQTGGNADEISKLIPNIRAMKGVMALTGVGGKEYNAILAEMVDVTGATDEAFNKQEKTFETLNNSLDKTQIITGNIGKHFADKIVVSLIEGTGAMTDFIMSNQGMEIVSQVAGTAAGAFELLKTGLFVLKDDLMEPLAELWNTASGELGELGGTGEAGAGAMTLFAGALELSASGLTIVIKIIEVAITSISDLVTASVASAQAVGSFFDLITGKAKIADVKENFLEAGEAFKTLGSGFTSGIGEIIETTKEEFSNFSTEVTASTLEISTNVKSTSDAAEAYVVSNWDAMLTGQTDFIEEYQEGQTAVDTSTTETVDNIAAENLGLIGTLKAAWNDYFSESSFSWGALYEGVMSGAAALSGGLSAITDLTTQNELDSITLRFQGEQDLLQEKLDQGLISQAEFDAQSEILKQAQIDKENAAKEKAFETNKAFDSADALMSGTAAVAGWWQAATSLGPIAGPIFAGVMSAATVGMTAAQISEINSQQFVPAREMGGMASGLTRINESGGEIVSLPDGSQVIPNDISSQIAGNSGGGTTINVSFAGAKISSDMDLKKITAHVSKELGKKLKAVS